MEHFLKEPVLALIKWSAAVVAFLTGETLSGGSRSHGAGCETYALETFS